MGGLGATEVFEMMNQQGIRQILYGGMAVGAWSPVARIYELIESPGTLDNEDYEPSMHEGDELLSRTKSIGPQQPDNHSHLCGAGE